MQTETDSPVKVKPDSLRRRPHRKRRRRSRNFFNYALNCLHRYREGRATSQELQFLRTTKNAISRALAKNFT